MDNEMVEKMVDDIKDMITEVGYDAKFLADPEKREYAQKTIKHIYAVLIGSKII